MAKKRSPMKIFPFMIFLIALTLIILPPKTIQFDYNKTTNILIENSNTEYKLTNEETEILIEKMDGISYTRLNSEENTNPEADWAYKITLLNEKKDDAEIDAFYVISAEKVLYNENFYTPSDPLDINMFADFLQ